MVRTLRIVQWMLLASVVFCVVAGELLGSGARAIDPSLSYIFTTAGVALVGIIFVVRRTLVLRSAETLGAHPDDAITLRHWKSGCLTTYALCEILALFGWVLRLLGCSFQQSVPFYIGGFLLLFFFKPQLPYAAVHASLEQLGHE
ncbi:MAG: hypothetical protein ACLQLC_16515 [Candidatus Sulfotelmatobacter sp.]